MMGAPDVKALAIKETIKKENRVLCGICSKLHEPIRAFWNSHGYFVCSEECIAIDVKARWQYRKREK
jgi:hypothetical protein